MASTQRQYVKCSIYHVTSPSGKLSDLEHLGSFELNGEKILMFRKLPKLNRRKKTKAAK